MKKTKQRIIIVGISIFLVCLFNFYSTLTNIYAKNNYLVGTNTKANIAKNMDQESVEAMDTYAYAFVAVVSVAVVVATISVSSSCGVLSPKATNTVVNPELKKLSMKDLLLYQLH